MDLFCEKYKETVPAETAYCKRPKEYCKFRTACTETVIQEKSRMERKL